MTTIKHLKLNDQMFLQLESREMMMHVAGLMQFTPASGTPRDHLRRLFDELRATNRVGAPWNRKLRWPEFLAHPLQAWVEEEHLDLDYHVRRSALPSPGDERELGIFVSRLHGHPLDLHRPPWELHIIEGLKGGRFALYMKVHHSLIDGFSAMRILSEGLAREPGEHHLHDFFAAAATVVAPVHVPSHEGATNPLQWSQLLAGARGQLDAAQTAGRAFREMLRASRSGQRDIVRPLSAPRCILNARIGRSRRFATQTIATARLRAVAKAASGTLNDAILALSGAAIRRYLLELGELPSAPLVAMLPVNVRQKDEVGGGNSVGAILSTLATDLDDPLARLSAVIGSTTRGKEQLQGMSQLAALEYSALVTSPFLLQLLPGGAGRLRPAFNLVISNVRGPEEPRYLGGARLDAAFPMSIPAHGLALNITCNSYAGNMHFGFIGCRDSVPHLQRLAVYFGEAMTELELSLGLSEAEEAGRSARRRRPS